MRDRAGKIHAFLNVCRHRGNRLCRAETGNAAAFICSYHGWVYSNDGSLQAVPNKQEAYYNELDQSQWGLTPVAQLDEYKGLIFATFDPAAPRLLDYLGDVAWYLDVFFDRERGWGRGRRRYAQVDHARQLEDARGELRRRRLPHGLEPPFSGNHRIRRELSHQQVPRRGDDLAG